MSLSSLTIKRWSFVHKWSSIVCTLFMLLLCITGLPLVFTHEIDHLSGNEVEAPTMPAGTPHATLDRILATARSEYPDRVVQYAAPSDEDPNVWFATMTPSPAPTTDFKSVAIDARTAQVLAKPQYDQGFMNLMRRLHIDLFAGLPGTLFLGLMGLLLLVAIVTGTVLYAPFMRKLNYGEVRRQRPRAKWLDLHNLLGITTLVWAFVVGATGMINTWADPLVKYWQYDKLQAILAPYQAQPLVPDAERAPAQQALHAAQAHTAHQSLSFVAFPGTAYSSPHHLTFFYKGDTPLTSRLLAPVMVDAKTATVTAAPELPWYLKALLVSQPLHFGDYGGLPMKILWAMLDIVTIIVLGSGLYLWLGKGKQGKTATAPNSRREPPRRAAAAVSCTSPLHGQNR